METVNSGLGLGRSKEHKDHLQAPSHFHVSYLCATHTYITPMVPYGPLTKEGKYSAHSHKSEIMLVLVERGLLLQPVLTDDSSGSSKGKTRQ